MDKDIIIKVGKSDKKLSDIEGSAKEHGVILESAALALINKIREQAKAIHDLQIGSADFSARMTKQYNQQVEEIKNLKGILSHYEP